ncbi:hypothetical protein sos41_21640 [Alphaproteobacteria bacterium SO-S41]|nr:hypothetical protein sos41_21640 [Alphaproteobacteria bacterium SO-S41]
MVWLIGGIAALLVIVTLLRAIADADPAKLVRWLKWTGIAVAGIVGLTFLVRRSVVPGLLALGLGAAILATLLRSGRPAVAGSSDVETDWLRMSLDHATGETEGVVLKGRHAGARLSELDVEALHDLLAEMRIADPQGALLLEAYLRRVHPDMEDGAGEAGAAPSAAAMGREEALEILGLGGDADEDAIREAHKRLMQQVHPDRGGSDYLAAKINLARDVLLKR